MGTAFTHVWRAANLDLPHSATVTDAIVVKRQAFLAEEVTVALDDPIQHQGRGNAPNP